MENAGIKKELRTTKNNTGNDRQSWSTPGKEKMKEYMETAIFLIINIFRVIWLKISQFTLLYFPGNFPYQNPNDCLIPLKIYYIQPKFNESEGF